MSIDYCVISSRTVYRANETHLVILQLQSAGKINNAANVTYQTVRNDPHRNCRPINKQKVLAEISLHIERM